MKKFAFKIAASLFLAIITTTQICAETPAASAPTPSLTEKYTNTEKNYSIAYPSTWKKAEVPRLDLVLFAPPKGSEDNTHASMNVVSEKVGPGITLEQFYSESAANLTTALTDVNVEKTGSGDIDGIPTKWVLYTHVMQNIKFRVLQYFLVAQDNVYLITFSSVADSFKDYNSEFENIVKSFKMTKQK